MKIYHAGLDVYDEVPDRRAKTMFESGWEPVDKIPEAAAAAGPDNVVHPDDPAVESITYTEAEMKKRKAKTKKAGSK